MPASSRTGARPRGQRYRRAMATGIALERHPWNVEFDWHVPGGPPRRLTPAQVDHFDTLGYVVVDDALDLETVATVSAALDTYEASVDRWLQRQDGGRHTIAETGAITFSPHAVTRVPEARELACDPRLTDICADLVGPDVNLYWDQAVYKKPEKPRRFPWHQDN